MIGVLGGGQLGQMLGLAGVPLGERFTFLDPSPDAPAAAVGDLITGAFDDLDALDALGSRCDVVTYEFEQVPASSVARVRAHAEVYPDARALAVAQDRIEEKRFFESAGLPIAAYAAVDDDASLDAALEIAGLPAVLKTRRLGYDGKGQAVVGSAEEARAARMELGGSDLICEAFVEFDRELSIICARDRAGDVVVYPLIENEHRDGILRASRAPAPGVSARTRSRAEAHASALLGALDYCGVMAVELFDCGGELYGNEMAPRVHNSGHWTIEGAETSQFENHLRAITGRPLGPATARGHSLMANLIGAIPDMDPLFRAGAHVHLYGKAPRPGRKLGHVTLTDDDPDHLTRRAAAVFGFS